MQLILWSRVVWGLLSPIFIQMKKMSLQDKVSRLIDEALDSRPDIFILDFKISDTNDIQVVIDGDHGVSIDDIVYLSRQIEHNLDRDEEDFSLTVSSFDITKPFHLKRQFKKNLNRNIKVKTQEGEKEGTLISVNDDKIVLEKKVREPKKIGKGKVTVIKQEEIPFDQIKDAKVVLKF